MQQTISLYQGDSYLLDLSFKNTDGTPTDLTDDTVILTVKSSLALPDSAALYKQVNVDHVLPEQGLSSVEIDSETTATLPRQAYFDIKWVHRIGGRGDQYIQAVTTLAAGEILTAPAVTQTLD